MSLHAKKELQAIPKHKFIVWHFQNLVGGQVVNVLTVLTYLFLFAPMIILIIYSFNAGRSTTVWQGFSFDWYGVLFKDRYVFQALKNSLIVALSAASIATTVGTLTVLTMLRRKIWGQELFSTLMLSPLVLPEIVLGVAFLVFMVFLNIQLGFGTLIIGHTVLALPYATLIVRAAASGLDITLEQAAADLGANEIRVGVRTTLRRKCRKMLPNKKGPKFIPAVAQYDGAQSKYDLSAVNAPAHTRFFHACTDQVFTGCFYYTRSDW